MIFTNTYTKKLGAVNQELTDFVCSICYEGEGRRITLFQGTVLCTECLDELKKHTQDSEKPLGQSLPQVVEYGMGDIYD